MAARAQAEERVQLVDGAVGVDARAILRDALAADEAGFALVALAGVDAIDGETRLIEGSSLIALLRDAIHFSPATKVEARRREAEDLFVMLVERIAQVAVDRDAVPPTHSSD